jgi:glycosyltransferase involved in cell wall biosynthesis
LITADDHSTDCSFELLEDLAKQEARIKFLRHKRNQGKGSAPRTLIRNASADIVLIHVADLEYEPADYASLLKPILRGKADTVFGFRLIDSHEHKGCIFGHLLGNRILTLLSHMTPHLNLTDMKFCYKVFNRDLIQSVTIEGNRFGIESSILTPKTEGHLFLKCLREHLEVIFLTGKHHFTSSDDFVHPTSCNLFSISSLLHFRNITIACFPLVRY